MPATVLGAARVITSGRVHAPGWVAVEQGRVAEVGSGRPAAP
ncbi:MAG: N-acetylglucosamine-6-phosphate deacetylase, partial [Marmoricola sp.]|nr:N-acetylglucosamine-6-phosphate deacetylase [Marmoricola sp.]